MQQPLRQSPNRISTGGPDDNIIGVSPQFYFVELGSNGSSAKALGVRYRVRYEGALGEAVFIMPATRGGVAHLLGRPIQKEGRRRPKDRQREGSRPHGRERQFGARMGAPAHSHARRSDRKTH